MQAPSTSPVENTAAPVEIFAALSNARRLEIITWLRDPVASFPTQVDGDLVLDGVCVGAIVTKLGVSQPAVTAHMKVLAAAGLVTSKRIKQWTFYQLEISALRRAEASIAGLLKAP
jgi:ArsR family transcriptional regulator